MFARCCRPWRTARLRSVLLLLLAVGCAGYFYGQYFYFGGVGGADFKPRTVGRPVKRGGSNGKEPVAPVEAMGKGHEDVGAAQDAPADVAAPRGTLREYVSGM